MKSNDLYAIPATHSSEACVAIPVTVWVDIDRSQFI